MQTIATSPTTRRGVLIENLMTSSTTAEMIKLALLSDQAIDEKDRELKPHVNLTRWILDNWYKKESHEIVDSQRYLIEQLIDELDTMRKECRGCPGHYYHGAIDHAYIFVSGDGKLRLTTDSSNCNRDRPLTENEYKSQYLYLPRVLQLNPNALLDPTVDELAFVRTVYQMVQPAAELRTMDDCAITILDARGEQETYLSMFLKNVAQRLDRGLNYSEDKAEVEANFKKNQAVVLEAIREEFPRRFLTEEELVAPNSEWDDLRNVYSAVNRILQDENWNELY